MANKSTEVTAIANGYYGGKVRVPGETFVLADSSDFSDRWMSKKAGEAPPRERFVATGGTDGVVGTTVEKKDDRKLTAKERKEREMAGISENDDRTDDFASSPANDAPAAEPADEGK